MILPLEYPPGYLELTPELKAEVCNGAGAKDGIKVPNTMWGLNCREAFNIHDYEYYMGENDIDKRAADRHMLSNSIILINNKGGMMSYLRWLRALNYYAAVAKLGKKAFYAGKEVNK